MTESTLEDVTTYSEEEVLEEIQGLNSDQQAFLKKSCQSDLYVLSKGVLRYKDVNPDTHGKFCRFFQNHAKRRRLGLMPRAHLKSTIATIADSLRLGLADPDNARVLIVGETATTARKFLTEIKEHVEKNKLIQHLFPELIPSRFSGPGVVWSQEMARLNRNSVWREPTWQAIGVGGAIVGGHFTRIKCDDLIGFDAARSPAAMAEAIAWVENIEPLLVDQHTDIIDWIGTRWARNDLYSHIIENYLDELAVFTRQAIENGEIIFPQKHSWEEYERIQRISPAVWYAQYCNNPLVSGQSDLDIHAVRSYKFSHDGQSVLFYDDSGKQKKWHLDQLDRVLCADPNSGSLVAEDTAAISLVGLSPDNEVFVLFSWSGRVTPSAFVDNIFDQTKRWRPRVVGLEKAGQQNTEHYFKLKTEQEDVYVQIEPLRPENKDKPTRIRNSLEPIIRSGQLYVLPSQTALREQISAFPNCLVWDELDALAYFTQIARKPMRLESQKERTKVLDLVMARRSKRTGY